jgi:DNA polymerase II small subunit
MNKEKLYQFLKDNEIDYFENFNLDENEIFELIKRINELKKRIKYIFLNKEIIEILLNLDIENENVLERLEEINWLDLKSLFLDYFNNKDSKRKKKIYFNFVEFLHKELDLDLSLNGSLNIKEITSSIIDENEFDIFRKYDNFVVNKDLNEKLKKFDVEVLFNYQKEPKKISVSDFVLYFNRRLNYFTNLLKNRINLENVIRIDNLKDLYGSNSVVSVIGLVSEIKNTAKGHYMIELEDKSGKINCFVNKDNKELIQIIEKLCLDEGIAIKGKIGDKIIWTDEIIIPSPPNENEYKTTSKEEYIMFLSDIHFGAGVFVDEAFQRLVDFLNGEVANETLKSVVKKIKYIIVPGDIIEGIGIYPNQGKDARILSAERQYHEAARWFKKFPKEIPIILIPGNHDTDRLSEPQPQLPYDKAYALYNLPNTIILSNPARIKIFNNDSSGGLEVYMYHGGSIFYYADKIRELREAGGAKVPEKVVEFLLEKRHLAPSHGATLYVPDNEEDPLVIKKMPDFFAVGHTHKMSISNYKGCTICSCGCWVEMSDYQEKMGMYPDVGKVILVNTKTRKPKILSFYTEKHKK